MQVVEQGQCIKENNIVHTAVTQVHPFVTNNACICDKSPISVSCPVAM